MKGWKTICQKLLFPPVWLIFILVAASAASLAAVFLKGWDAHPAASVVYVISFYTVTVLTIFFVKVFPGWYGKVRQKIYDNKLGNRYMTDVAFKTHVSLYLSLVINLLYVGTNILSFFLNQSAWFAILAVYYTILAVMRFLLVRYVNQKKIGEHLIDELKRSRICAVILMTINLTLSGAVLMILYQNRGYEYNGIMIYVMAMYTFYTTTHAIVDIVKYRKLGSPVLSATKVIALSAALVSMLSLETAMLSRFGEDSTPQFRRIMVAATGGGVSIIVVTMSVYMIVRANREIKRLKASQP